MTVDIIAISPETWMTIIEWQKIKEYPFQSTSILIYKSSRRLNQSFIRNN